VIVDAHAHVIVSEITRDAAPREMWRPRVFWEGQRQVVEVAGKVLRSAARELVQVDGVLAAMSAAGVDRVVLCPYIGLLRYDAEPAEALESSRIQNAALARLARSHPDRISALGTVPLQDPRLAAGELEALMGRGDLRGVEVTASVRGVFLGDDRFRPFWEAAEATGAVVFVHPTTREFEIPVLQEYFLQNTVGNPIETTIAAAHMIMAGLMEAHPRLRVLLAHGGGAILSVRGRLRHAHTFHAQARARLRESPEASLKRFYFDTITHDPELLRALVSYVGADSVLLGSDYPFDMGLARPGEAVRALELPPGDERKILGGNAARLLGVGTDEP
jgi:aminocarboxymuconate-semialdehyde decarboxylase